MYDSYPSHSHRTPQQIAEDAGGAFEVTVTRRMKVSDMSLKESDTGSSRSDPRGKADARKEPA